jgi:hypothetical protein
MRRELQEAFHRFPSLGVACSVAGVPDLYPVISFRQRSTLSQYEPFSPFGLGSNVQLTLTQGAPGMNARTLATAAAAALVSAALTGGTVTQTAKPAPYTLGRVVVEQNVTLVNMQNDSGDFLYNPVTGTQTRPVMVDCPAGKVPLSGGGKITTSAYAPLYTDKPVMVLADSRPTATGWTLTWLATGNGMPGSGGTQFICPRRGGVRQPLTRTARQPVARRARDRRGSPMAIVLV